MLAVRREPTAAAVLFAPCRRRLGAVVSALCLGASLAAQSLDERSVDRALADASWQEEVVGDGVTLRRAWLPELYGAPQSLCVLTVDKTGEDRRLRLACAPEPGCTLTSRLAAQRGALAAVNGGFFKVKEEVPVGLLIVDGELRHEQSTKVTAGVGIDRRERVHLEDRGVGGWNGMEHARGSYPLVVRKGKPVEKQGWGEADIRHPRTAVGTKKGGGVVFVTVDGRTEKASGMTLLELAHVMRWLGCEEAMNLDGGGSTTMWVRGRGVVNHPCDNTRFDPAGERAVTDALCLLAAMIVEVDEDRARLEPADGWEPREDRAALGGDFALCVGAPDADARAVFELAVDAPGAYALEVRWPKVRGRACEVDCAIAGRDPVRVSSRRRAGRWVPVGVFDLPAGSVELVLTRAAAGPFGVDAVRLVER